MLSHIEVQESDRVIQERVESIKNRLRSTDETALMLPLEETLALVDAMAKCDGLGRWLLIHQGLNGFWTAELILRHAGQNPSEFARWLAYDAPGFRSTRERFYIFRDQLHALIEKGNKHFVSVPCGTMEELFTLEPKNPELLQFTGVDLDPLAEKWIQEAEARYPQVSAVKKTFLNHNAFDLGAVVQNADVVVSNGLNVYVANDEEVINLYRSFASVLKKGGTLVTSHLSPREGALPYDREALKKQGAIFKDIGEMKWQIYRSEEQMREHLGKAGFMVLNVIWDSQRIFPTYIAEKI
jgi:hypothetical protein